MMQKLFVRSTDMAKLRAFFENAPADGRIEWREIANHTDVKMDYRGKQLVRSALRSLGRDYHAIRGVGLQLEGKDTALAIVNTKGCRVYNGVKRLGQSSERLFGRWAPQLSQHDRERLGLVAGLAGAMIGTAKALRSLRVEKPKMSNDGGGVVPLPAPVKWTSK